MSDSNPQNTTVQALVTSSGFTPCPDVLVKLFSHTTALVWGKIWRYSEMTDGVCKASIERMAQELGMTENTFAKHVKLLEGGGYVKDATPDVRNKPHVYLDTGKIRIKIKLEMGENIGAQNLRSRYANFEVEESTTKGLRGKSKIFKAYAENIGELKEMMKEILTNAIKEYSAVWVYEAIYLAVENNKLNWRYCETILKRWKKDGKDEGKGKPQSVTDKSKKKFPKIVNGKIQYDKNGDVIYVD